MTKIKYFKVAGMRNSALKGIVFFGMGTWVEHKR